MAFKSVAVSVGTVDTDVYEMPATTQGAVVLGIGNVNASARTITLKFYNANLNTTTTIVSGYSIAANTFVKWPKPILMATGDKIIMSASNSSSIVADAAITDSASAPVATGFTARGDWNNAITYNANDLVWVDDAISAGRGASYIAKVNASPNINKDPTTETAFWMRYAGDGPAGGLSASDIGVTVQAYDANTAKLNVEQTFTAPQSADPGTLTHNTAWNGASKQLWDCTVNGSAFTIANPSALRARAVYVFRVSYTTSHTVNFGSNFKGTIDTPTASSGKVDYFIFMANAGATALEFIGASLDITP